MLLCDVIAEQNKQKELRDRKKQMEKEIDLQWEELER